MTSVIARVWRKIAGLPPATPTQQASQTIPTPAPVATTPASKTAWSFERDDNTITIVVRDERGSLVGSHRMTKEQASLTAAQLWNLANFGMPEDFKPTPKEVSTNDPEKVADAIFKAPAYATVTAPPPPPPKQKKPFVKSLGPAFTVNTWPITKVKQLIGRTVRFAFVDSDNRLRNGMGTIIEVMPYGRRRMLTIETEVGSVILFRPLEDVELFGNKETAFI